MPFRFYMIHNQIVYTYNKGLILWKEDGIERIIEEKRSIEIIENKE